MSVAIDTQLSPNTYRASLHLLEGGFSFLIDATLKYPKFNITFSWSTSRHRLQGDDNQAVRNKKLHTGLRDISQDQRLAEIPDDTLSHHDDNNNNKGMTVISKEDHPWISELEDLGLSEEEIQSLLKEQSRDSPWIRFIPRSKVEATVQPGRHIANCVHKWQPESDAYLVTMDDKTYANQHVSEHPDIIRNIQELCGLAGIIPETDDQYPAAETVSFRNDNTIANVSYAGCMNDSPRRDNHDIWTTIKAALKSFCHAAVEIYQSGSTKDLGL